MVEKRKFTLEERLMGLGLKAEAIIGEKEGERFHVISEKRLQGFLDMIDGDGGNLSYHASDPATDNKKD